MRKFTPLIFALLLFWITPLYGQVNFRKGLEEANPVSKDSTFSAEEILKVHELFLEKGIQEKDQLNQLHAYLLIFYDYLKIADYIEARKYLLEAERIAENSNKPGWLGWVKYREGNLNIKMVDEVKAIVSYEKAVALCREAGDSLCVGESLEQLSAMNALSGDYEKALSYFNAAMPLLQEFGSEKHVSTAQNNFGILLSQKGKPREAIPYLERAVTLNHKIKLYRSEAKSLNNLADAHRRLELYDEAIKIYKKALALNFEHEYSRNRMFNYMGLSLCYEGKREFEQANEYLIKRFSLRDSLTGLAVQEKIAALEVKFESQQKELKLKEREIQLVESRQKTERIGGLLLFVLLCSGIAFWALSKKKQELNSTLAQNQKNLISLTNTLIRKNDQILNLEKELSDHSIQSESANLDESLYNKKVLTDDDWTVFKSNFEKSIPGYILQLRKTYPSLSEAEERLFLFIKLNLTKKEIASILGISTEGVKKTRQRLRKKLGMYPTESLENFIQNFKKPLSSRS